MRFFLPVFLLAGIVVLVILGVVYYASLHKPLYISPVLSLPHSVSVSPDAQISMIKKQLTEKQIEYTKVTQIGPETYAIQLVNNGEVIVTGNKDIAQQIDSLQYVIERLTMEDKRFSRLDLEFDKPVITF